MIYLSCLFDTSCYVDAAGRANGPLYTPKGKFMQVIMISTQYLCIKLPLFSYVLILLYMYVELSDLTRRGEAFLKENLNKPGVRPLANGVQYRVIKDGPM